MPTIGLVPHNLFLSFFLIISWAARKAYGRSETVSFPPPANILWATYDIYYSFNYWSPINIAGGRKR